MSAIAPEAGAGVARRLAVAFPEGTIRPHGAPGHGRVGRGNVYKRSLEMETPRIALRAALPKVKREGCSSENSQVTISGHSLILNAPKGRADCYYNNESEANSF